DDLTGLYNRRGFFTLAEQQMSLADRRNAELFVLYADLDGLKQINDTRGHEEGDRVLMEVAGVLRKTFRESDVVARIGGDEFVVLAFEAQPSSAEVVIARLERNLNKLNLRKDRPYRLSLSAGIARYTPGSERSIDELLAQADRSMYERKARRGVH
ncbi:MAG: GGDEF domain-containing protein, partial [Gemmatimonadetes bacterium]|nr:GGDEF domain-containing protein [Gemmatimonadota bacterium]